MVNSAGTNAIGHFWEIAHADWRRVLDVNLLAVTRAAQDVVPPLIAAGGGSIINIASVHAFRPAAGRGFLSFLAMVEDLGLRAGIDGQVVRHASGDVRPRVHRHAELELNLVVRGRASYLLPPSTSGGRRSTPPTPRPGPL